MTTAALSSERRTISVVQYNVLAEGLSNPAMSPDAGFTSMPPEQMRWAHRGELVLDRLRRVGEAPEQPCALFLALPHLRLATRQLGSRLQVSLL